MTDVQVYVGAAVIGAVAGMRSMTAPALVSRLARSGLSLESMQSSLLDRPPVARTVLLFAAGELIADKLPFMPKRTQPPSVVFRAISGGLSGAAVCSSKKRSRIAGVLIGAAAAVGATYGAYELRRRAGERFHIPDWPIALLEDAIAASCGAIVVSKLLSE